MGSKSNRSRRYSEEFKREAVALVRSSGKTVTEVAREIGVSAEGLRNWVKQDTIDRGQGSPGELTSAERKELIRLRRQNREQAETIEVLRKARSSSRRRAIDERGVRVHRGGEDHPQRCSAVPAAEGGPLLLLRLAGRRAGPRRPPGRR
ncbi:transposase [Streptomyces antibioticus]|uniref:transposase n=1 Tax=Streptomyces antibioticus TaxID=1890 RepID=UPI00367E405F